MRNVNLADAQTHLSELVEHAAAGEAVCITRRGKAVAQINARLGRPLSDPLKAAANARYEGKVEAAQTKCDSIARTARSRWKIRLA